MKQGLISWLAAGFLAVCLSVPSGLAAEPGQTETSDRHPWYGSLSMGYLDVEGDEVMDDSSVLLLHLGYDWTERWSLEGILTVMPELDENFRNSYGKRISRMREASGKGVRDTYALGYAVEGLYHFTRWERLDPYLAVGGGLAWFADDIGKELEGQLRAGAGAMYHLSDAWALRADGRVLFTGADTEFNMLLTAGIVWTPGAHAAPAMAVAGTAGGTIPPAVAPVAAPAPPPEPEPEPDTDKDEVQLFVLQIQFEPGKWEIRPEYYSEIGVIGKILKDNPAATARIEGHIDALPGVAERDNLRLTEKRAGSVRRYLGDHWNIAGSRMKAIGYGTSRPMGPNDPVAGNLDNRRIEVYVRKP